MRRSTARARNLIKRFEGLVLNAYQDAVGRWTVGYGHTDNVLPEEQIDVPTAERLLDLDILEAERSIHNLVPEVFILRLSDKSYDALVSFVFNVGRQAFVRPGGSRTDFYRALVGDDLTRVCAEMQRWVRGTVNGQAVVLPGLVERRGAEAALFGEGIAPPDRQQVTDPEPPRTKVLETPTGAGAAAAGGAGLATAASALTSSGQSMIPGADSIALLLGIALIIAGVVLAIWVAKR